LIINGFFNFKNQLFDTMCDTKITPSILGFFPGEKFHHFATQKKRSLNPSKDLLGEKEKAQSCHI
jgi:hypothetical protein